MGLEESGGGGGAEVGGEVGAEGAEIGGGGEGGGAGCVMEEWDEGKGCGGRKGRVVWL